MQKPARILQENQIDFHFIPADVFAEREFYRTELGKELIINEKRHKMLVVPYAQYITQETAEGIAELTRKGHPVLFLEKLPDGICQGGELPEEISTCRVVALDEFLEAAQESCRKIRIIPASHRLRTMHVKGEHEAVFIVNEDDQHYKGEIYVPWEGSVSSYDAWENKVREMSTEGCIQISLRPSESIVLLRQGKGMPGTISKGADEKTEEDGDSLISLTQFQVSYCRSIHFPHHSASAWYRIATGVCMLLFSKREARRFV